MNPDFRNDHTEELNRKEHRRKNVGVKAVLVYGYDATTDSYYPITATPNADGTYSLSSTSSPTAGYAISNIEETATYKYFGFENKNGAWYIMRKTLATNVFEYAAGASAYSTAWTNKASQTYASYGTTF